LHYHYKLGLLLFPMPLLNDIWLNEHTRLALWEFTEGIDKALEHLELDSISRQRFEQFHHEKRQEEWLASKLLLESIGFNHSISYLDNGKPVVNGHIHFSLSHCLPYVAVVVSDRPCGIDLQKPEAKMLRIKDKFCHEEEWLAAEASASPLDYVSLLWSAKEALFKVYGENLIFKEQLRIAPFDLDDELFSAKVHLPGGIVPFTLRKELVSGHWLVSTVMEK
jgi:4'-phosphopantetheinyl transferase